MLRRKAFSATGACRAQSCRSIFSGSFCNLMAWCQTNEQQVFATAELPEEDEQDSDEILICRILKDNGPVSGGAIYGVSRTTLASKR